MKLKGKVALVTGSARGLGLAIARALFDQGAIVAVADVDQAAAGAAAAALDATGTTVVAVRVDVSNPASIAAMTAAVLKRFGSIDILVNNAGIGANAPFLETRLEDWDRIMSVNLTGAFLVAQSCAREMVKRGEGKIVNITSLSGQRGGHGRAAYGAAKAGLELLTKVMAVELAPNGINVNSIAPGAIETEMARTAHDESTKAAYGYLIPMSRYGTPEEVAKAAVFLCSDDSRYVHGHTLNVDGGFGGAGLMFGPGKTIGHLS